MRFIRCVLAVAVVSSMSACSYIYGENGLIRDSSYDYLKARQTKDLVMPEGIQQKDKIDYTVVPRIEADNAATGKSLDLKAPVQVLDVLDNTRLKKNADAPTVLITDKKDFIWNTVQTFIKEHAIKISQIDDKTMHLETDWVPLDEDGVWLGIEGDEEADQFRAKYDISLIEGDLKSEYGLRVQRTIAQWRDDDDEPWQDKPSFWGDSAEMLNQLIGNYETQRNVRILARRQQVLAGFRVELGKDTENAPALLTNADPALVWEKLPKVFSEMGLKQVDKDVQQKTYYIEYNKEEEGFWASLFSDDKPELPIPFGDYQVVLSAAGQQLAMTFKDGEGNPISADLLVKLYPDLQKFFGDRR